MVHSPTFSFIYDASTTEGSESMVWLNSKIFLIGTMWLKKEDISHSQMVKDGSKVKRFLQIGARFHLWGASNTPKGVTSSKVRCHLKRNPKSHQGSSIIIKVEHPCSKGNVSSSKLMSHLQRVPYVWRSAISSSQVQCSQENGQHHPKVKRSIKWMVL